MRKIIWGMITFERPLEMLWSTVRNILRQNNVDVRTGVICFPPQDFEKIKNLKEKIEECFLETKIFFKLQDKKGLGVGYALQILLDEIMLLQSICAPDEDIFLRLDDDVKWLKQDSLFKMIKFMDLHPDWGWVAPIHSIDTMRLWKTFKSKWNEKKLSGIARVNIASAIILYRRSICRKVGKYDETFKYGADRDYWARLIKKGFIVGQVVNAIHNCQSRFTKGGASQHKEKHDFYMQKLAEKHNDILTYKKGRLYWKLDNDKFTSTLYF